MATLSNITSTQRNRTLTSLYNSTYQAPALGSSKTLQSIFITARRVVDASQVTAMLKDWEEEDRKQSYPPTERHLAKSHRRPGPTPWIDTTQILYLLVASTLRYQGPLFTNLTELVLHASAGDLHVLGIKDKPQNITEQAIYHRLYNTYRRLLATVNPYQGISFYRRHTRTAWEQAEASIDQNFFDNRVIRAHHLNNALLYGTYLLLPAKKRAEIEASQLDVVIDATRVKAAAEGASRTSRYVSADPTAGWYTRHGDHNGTTSRADTKYTRKKEVLEWAFEAHTADAALPDGLNLILGLGFDKPGTKIATNAKRAINAILDKGFTPGHLVADRAYLPGTKPEELALPMRAAGFKLVFDFPKNHLGKQGEGDGAILVDGARYCPAMPQPLINATYNYQNLPADDPHALTDEIYTQQLAQREPYRLKLKQAPNAKGQVRYSCPALGEHATIRCPFRDPDPKVIDKPLKLIPKSALPTNPQKICTQHSISLSVSNGAKYEQAYPHRSQQWTQKYSVLRNVVESMNASLKHGAFAPIDDAQMRPRRGWAAQFLSTALLVVATNVRQIVNALDREIQQIIEAQQPRRRAPRITVPKGWEPANLACNSPPDDQQVSEAA